MKLPIKFSKEGPNGWLAAQNKPLETAKLVSGKAVGLDHIYYKNSSPSVQAGIWRSSPYTEFYEEYPCDEFMYIIEGSVTIEADNFKATYCKEEAFLLPKGFRGYWKQEEPMLKYYVIIS